MGQPVRNKCERNASICAAQGRGGLAVRAGGPSVGLVSSFAQPQIKKHLCNATTRVNNLQSCTKAVKKCRSVYPTVLHCDLAATSGLLTIMALTPCPSSRSDVFEVPIRQHKFLVRHRHVLRCCRCSYYSSQRLPFSNLTCSNRECRHDACSECKCFIDNAVWQCWSCESIKWKLIYGQPWSCEGCRWKLNPLMGKMLWLRRTVELCKRGRGFSRVLSPGKWGKVYWVVGAEDDDDPRPWELRDGRLFRTEVEYAGLSKPVDRVV